eukprot:TRINITY_DN2237_c1_g1_i1.p1 TRINITY_DN2237_c1_g1~~TRINITY_DN2237_c1_g1_i1.p1  ORF type:complete len:205 (+),score=24.71 TRINITY_DN2237_c1_g1_i1:51-617(+)
MALYGWALRAHVQTPQDGQSGSQMLQRSKHAIARAYCLLFWIGMDDNDEVGAFRMFSTECDQSDPHVQCLLGECYRWGYGCTENAEQAIQCFERAGNHLEALSNLGLLLFEHKDCPIADRHRAVAMYRQAVTQGYASAQYRLGCCYERGVSDVLEKDVEQAKHRYSLAVEQGHDYAINALRRLSRLLY